MSDIMEMVEMETEVAEVGFVGNLTDRCAEAVSDFADEHPIATTVILGIGAASTFFTAFVLGKKAVNRGKDAVAYTKEKMAEKKEAKQETAATVDGQPAEATVEPAPATA